jgi:hypothetical protein
MRALEITRRRRHENANANANASKPVERPPEFPYHEYGQSLHIMPFHSQFWEGYNSAIDVSCVSFPLLM